MKTLPSTTRGTSSELEGGAQAPYMATAVAILERKEDVAIRYLRLKDFQPLAYQLIDETEHFTGMAANVRSCLVRELRSKRYKGRSWAIISATVQLAGMCFDGVTQESPRDDGLPF